MKLLLTSTGISNQEIENELTSLLTKPTSHCKVCFITLAALSDEEKDFTNASYQELLEFGFTNSNISNIDKGKKLLDILDKIDFDIIYVCGGNTFHLLKEIQNANASEKFKEKILNDTVYIGVSAGTILVTPSIKIASVEPADENLDQVTDFKGLNFVDFEISPHSPEVVDFEKVKTYAIQNIVNIYAISNDTALVVNNNELKVIGEKLYRYYQFKLV
jgi:dipeptidase E